MSEQRRLSLPGEPSGLDVSMAGTVREAEALFQSLLDVISNRVIGMLDGRVV